MLVVGIVVGLLVGVLPGLTLVMGVVLALPFTYGWTSTPAILLTAMYVSGTYGGAFTSILFRIPGEPIDVPLLWDGYAMARRGRPPRRSAGRWSPRWSAGCCRRRDGAADAAGRPCRTAVSPRRNFSRSCCSGLRASWPLGGGRSATLLISLCLGLLIATVGVDAIYGAERFTFGVPFLPDGIEFLVVMVGAYGVGEVLSRLEPVCHQGRRKRGASALQATFPRLPKLPPIKGMFLRGTATGIVSASSRAPAPPSAFRQLRPGGPVRQSARGYKLGTASPRASSHAKAAATASVGGALVPLLTLGIPGSGATAMILGAFMLHGIQPGPQVSS